MPIRGSPNGARHPRPQAGRDRPEWVVAINRNAWSQSIGTAGRNHPVCAHHPGFRASRRQVGGPITLLSATGTAAPAPRLGAGDAGGAG